MSDKRKEGNSPQQQAFLDQIMPYIEKGDMTWTKGWIDKSVPESAINGKPYRGMNRFYLSLVAWQEGYDDNRWVTYKQMESKGWTFKKDEEGKSIAKGKSRIVEFFELRDKETKRPFDRSVLEDMSIEEQNEYISNNVYFLRKSYRVFNCSLIDGVPALERGSIDINARIDSAENILNYWNENEARIIYGGSEAYYQPSTDEIHLPKRSFFKSMQSFYATAFHEMGHSTGHENRLNRDLTAGFGSQEYAMEELRAEFASMFLEQEFGIKSSESHIQNNAAYLKAWSEEIKDNPKALFTAVADAEKISKYVVSKEKTYKKLKNLEFFAIATEQDIYGQDVFKCYICDGNGGIKPLINYGFSDEESLAKEIDKVMKLPSWSDKTFEEVGIETLKEKAALKVNIEDTKQEVSEEYKRPSEIEKERIAAKALPQTAIRVGGMESLTRMSDRETLEIAQKHCSKDGRFNNLYNGKDVFQDEEKNEYALMVRLAVFTDGDKEQLLRLFKSSGQYREDKPNSYYLQMADKGMKFVEEENKKILASSKPKIFGKGNQSSNSKR